VTTRAAQILAALKRGAITSKEIAAQVPTTRQTISVLLCRLADRGLVEPFGVARTMGAGRPFVKWRVRAPSARRGD
jgi:predicted ArsR family transcriptional regulator